MLTMRPVSQATLVATKGRKPPKLVHKLMFSTPPGTPPDEVLGAVRNLPVDRGLKFGDL